MIKIYHYIFFSTYIYISKTNSISPKSSTARLISLCFLINIFTIYFLILKKFDAKNFYIFSEMALIVCFFNFWYFLQKNKYEEISNEFKLKKMALV